MTITKKKVSRVNVGDWIELDIGYGPHSQDEFCEVLSISIMRPLFDDDSNRISFNVKYGSLVFDTVGFNPDNYILCREAVAV